MSIGAALLATILEMIYFVTEFYIWILIISAVMSWLVAFEVINVKSPNFQAFSRIINRLTDPPLRYIRRLLPPQGGIDFSPLILIFIIWLVRNFIFHLVVG